MSHKTVLMTFAKVSQISTRSADKAYDRFIWSYSCLSVCSGHSAAVHSRNDKVLSEDFWPWFEMKKCPGKSLGPVMKFYNMWADRLVVSCDSMFPGASDLFQLHVLNLVSYALIKNRVWRHRLGVIPAVGLVLKVLEPSVLKDKMSSSIHHLHVVESGFNMYSV